MRMESGKSTHVVVLMDDVLPLNIDVPTMLQVMEVHGLDVLSPSILPHCNWANMNQGRGHLLKRTQYADTLMVIFKRPAFECWKSLIDLERNRNGRGYDVAVGKLCNVSIAVSDQYLVVHTTVALAARRTKNVCTNSRLHTQNCGAICVRS